MALYDHRVFRHGDEWWVGEVHSASGAGAGPAIRVTEDRVTFTCLSDEKRESRTATIPTGFLNRMDHASVVKLLDRAELYGSRFPMSPFNAPNAAELGNLPVIQDDEGLRWVVRRVIPGPHEAAALVEVICLDDSALKREIIVPRGLIPDDAKFMATFGDDVLLVRTVKATFTAYQGHDADDEGAIEPTAAQIAVVEAWLRGKFADAHVESGRIFDRDVVLFRARDRKAPAPAKEIEISYEAFEDHILTDIQDALERQNAVRLLAQHPTRRLFLSRDLVLRASEHDPRR